MSTLASHFHLVAFCILTRESWQNGLIECMFTSFQAGVVAAKSLLRKSCTVLDNPKHMVPSWTEMGARLFVTRFLNGFIATGCLMWVNTENKSILIYVFYIFVANLDPSCTLYLLFRYWTKDSLSTYKLLAGISRFLSDVWGEYSRIFCYSSHATLYPSLSTT